MDGVWASAAANMATYLLLKQRAAEYRADPEVQTALEQAGVTGLRDSTLDAGESLADLRAGTADFDPEVARRTRLRVRPAQPTRPRTPGRRTHIRDNR